MTDPRTTTAPLLFAGDVFCDLVLAGIDLPEPGAEVYAEIGRAHV